MLKIDLEYERNIFFIRLNGTLNHHNISKINNYIIPVLKKHKIKYLILNLKHLKNINESLINAILNIKCTIKNNEGKMYLCEVNKDNLKKLERLHIKKTSSEKAALSRLEVCKG